jgi:hypothetical protein
MANWVVKAIEMDRNTSSLIRVLPQKGVRFLRDRL